VDLASSQTPNLRETPIKSAENKKTKLELSGKDRNKPSMSLDI
jgi:hypothetical protein